MYCALGHLTRNEQISQNVCSEKDLMKHNGHNDSEIIHLSQSHYYCL